jgi:hypothetical protein
MFLMPLTKRPSPVKKLLLEDLRLEALIQSVKAQGLEGLVAKRRGQPAMSKAMESPTIRKGRHSGK